VFLWSSKWLWLWENKVTNTCTEKNKETHIHKQKKRNKKHTHALEFIYWLLTYRHVYSGKQYERNNIVDQETFAIPGCISMIFRSVWRWPARRDRPKMPVVCARCARHKSIVLYMFYTFRMEMSARYFLLFSDQDIKSLSIPSSVRNKHPTDCNIKLEKFIQRHTNALMLSRVGKGHGY
jgi:hypothetical protein